MATPEGVTLDVGLAGIGSRLTATVIDQLIRLGIFIGFVLLGGLIGGLSGIDDGGYFVLALIVVAAFLVQFGYDIAFEAFSSGQTPGKRLSGIRVVKLDGSPVTFRASAVRNVLRFVDALPSGYLVGMISILVSKRNQRLGDLAAGTIVITERAAPSKASAVPWSDEAMAAATSPLGHLPDGVSPRDAAETWDVSAVTAEELATLRRFLERRSSLTAPARARLGADLAARLEPKVAGQPDNLSAERFLEGIVAIKVRRQ